MSPGAYLRVGEDRSRPADRRPYAVLDIETDGLRGTPVYAVAGCDCPGGPRRVTFRGSTIGDQLYRHVSAGNEGSGRARHPGWRDHLWWAHNGAGYDYLYLLPAIRAAILADPSASAIPVSRSDAIIGWRLSRSKHRTDLRDSWSLLPSSLAALAASFAPDLPKLAAPFDADGRGFDPAAPAHRAYAMRDVDALLAALAGFRDLLAAEFGGVAPSWSAASTALRAWRATHEPGAYFHPPPPAAVLARTGYVGGMVRLTTTAPQRDLVTVDVNSMYPATMRAGVPDGIPVHRRRLTDEPGFWRVRVTVPHDEPWTFLPWRAPDRSLAWPTGTFDTVVSTPEVRRALGRGYRVDVDGGVVWPGLAYPFGDYVDRIERLRARGGAHAATGKILGNGLYGKFGAHPTHDDWIVAARPPGPDWYPPAYDLSDPDEVEAHAGLWCRFGVPIRGDYLMPHWAAWITAGARLALADLADRIGPESIVYADTDSLTLPAAALPRLADRIGPAFGALKLERRWSSWQAWGPKVYAGTDAATGEIVARAKGVPRRYVLDALAGETVAWRSPTGSLGVLRGRPMAVDRTRALSSLANSRAWRADGETVRPIHLDNVG